MDLTTWFWTYDRRWMFNIKNPYLDLVWLLPIAVDTSLGVMTVRSLFFENNLCMEQFGYQNWLETQLAFQCLSVVLIVMLFFRFRQIDRIEGKMFEHVNRTKAFNPKNYKYWTRTQGLLSILGFGVLSLGFIKFVWTWVGYIMYSQHSLETICSDSFRDTFLSNFIVPLACLIPIGFTLVMFFAIKILNLLLSIFMPTTFVWISKRL